MRAIDKNWSYDGAGALFDFLEDAWGEESREFYAKDFDMEWHEYETIEEAPNDLIFGFEIHEGLDEDERNAELMKSLSSVTTVLEAKNGHVIVDYNF